LLWRLAPSFPTANSEPSLKSLEKGALLPLAVLANRSDS
jgi:hypothetical protein